MEKSFCPYCMSRVIPGESCPQCGLTAGNYVPSPHHLPPGTVLLGRYLVGRALGEGGFGITYIGYDLRLELKVAIKEYYPVDRATRNSAVSLSVTSFVGPSSQSFQRGKEKYLVEARAMAKMDKQQAIVSVRDFFEENNTAYIVMEYIDGTTFCDLVKQRGRIPPGELFPLLEPLFGDLALMHEHGLIHRDISPDNLMLEHGVVRLLDFGCARESTRGTETLTIALKQGYAPVEQYQQKGQGPWTDIYALCATIYFCLTGKAPPQALDRITADGLVPPSKLGVPIPPGQEDALLKGLRLSPGRRFRSMEEFHGALYSPQPPSFPEDPEDADAEEDSPAILQEQDTPPATQEPEEQRSPVVTQEASDTDGVVVYRVDYRLQGEGNLAPLLDQGMAAETIDGATWLTPGNSPSQPYCAFRWTIRDGEQLWTWIGNATPADLQSRYGDQGASLQAQLDAFAAEMLGP